MKKPTVDDGEQVYQYGFRLSPRATQASAASRSVGGCSINGRFTSTLEDFDLSDIAQGKRLLTATAAFRSEPFASRLAHANQPHGWLSLLQVEAGLGAGQRGVAAVEFALLLPIMVTLYFGGIEVSTGVAADLKG